MKRHILKSKGVSVALSTIVMMQTLLFSTALVNADSEEIEEFVDRCYEVCLERDADPNGLEYWSSELESKNVTGYGVAAGFIYSQEYDNRNRTDEEFVRDLYKLFMDREPDQGGLENWLNALKGGMTRPDVFKGFASSQEFENICSRYGIIASDEDLPEVSGDATRDFVKRLYTTVLNRDAEEEGLNFWTESLKKGNVVGADCAANFILSDEFQSKELSSEEYVKILYKAFMDREADPDGLKFWTDSIKEPSDKIDVFYGFAYSEEFRNICDSYGIICFREEAEVVSPKLRRTIETDIDGKTRYTTYLYDDEDNYIGYSEECDGKIRKVTYIGSDVIYEEPDGSKVVEGSDFKYTKYNPDGSVKSSGYSSVDKELDDGSFRIDSYDYDGNYLGYTVSVFLETNNSKPVNQKHYYYDAEGKPDGFEWWVREAVSNDLFTGCVDKYLDENGNLLRYTKSEIHGDERWDITYDASGKAIEKFVYDHSHDAFNRAVNPSKACYINGVQVNKNIVTYDEYGNVIKEEFTDLQTGKTSITINEYA